MTRAVLDGAMTEAQLFESVRAHLNAFGWLWVHHYDSRRSNEGFPDICAVRLAEGRVPRLLFAELKRQNGVVSDTQWQWLQSLKVVGAETYLWRPSDLSSSEVERVLR